MNSTTSLCESTPRLASIETDQLQGLPLDWAVAQSIQSLKHVPPYDRLAFFQAACASESGKGLRYSESPKVVLDLAKEHGILFFPSPVEGFKAVHTYSPDEPRYWSQAFGSTQEIAVLRCLVKVKSGDCVQIPAVLLEEESSLLSSQESNSDQRLDAPVAAARDATVRGARPD